MDPGAENPRYPRLEKLYSGTDPVAGNLCNPGWNVSGGSRCCKSDLLGWDQDLKSHAGSDFGYRQVQDLKTVFDVD